MPDPKETDLKNEIDQISKTIDQILGKIEAERERLLPADSKVPSDIKDNDSGNDDSSFQTGPKEAGPPLK